MVAAIVAGEPGGIAEAYDRYAASLYAYCHWLLPRPQAAEALRDTFLIAVSRLDGLGDPDRLEAWLHAVARNECLRRLGPRDPKEPRDPEGPAAGVAAAATPVSRSGDPDEPPAVTLPTGLRRQVLTACADNSPAGRARRVSVTHRAGVFGPSGFPKSIGPAGPWWWRRVQRHPRSVAVVAVMAAVAAAAGITMITTASGSHRTQASALGLGAGVAGLPSSATPTPRTPRPPGTTGSPSRVSVASSPAHQAGPSASPSAPAVTMPAGAPSPVPPSVTMSEEPSAAPSPTSSSASPSPSPSASPAQGHLLLAPDNLLLTSAKGKTASGFFVLTATGGPVSEYTIKVPAAMAGQVTVSPSRGSLPANGYAAVSVTVTSNVALSTHVTVEPGNLTVRVVLKIKA